MLDASASTARGRGRDHDRVQQEYGASEALSAGTSRAYAEHHDYNRDLLEVLRAEEAAGGLRIEAIEPDVLGLNPDNATTLVRWSAGT